jgi:hypothetical protein
VYAERQISERRRQASKNEQAFPSYVPQPKEGAVMIVDALSVKVLAVNGNTLRLRIVGKVATTTRNMLANHVRTWGEHDLDTWETKLDGDRLALESSLGALVPGILDNAT